MTVTFQIRREQNLFATDFEKTRERMVRSFGVSAFTMANKIKSRGDANIRGAGRFSARWTRAFQAQVTPNKIGATAYRIVMFFRGIPYAHVHEFGALIRGKPSLFNRSGLLWIPLSFAHIPSGVTAQEFGTSHGGLFRVNRKGKNPLLLSVRDKKPKYVGVASVRLRQRFRIREIVDAAAAEFSRDFDQALAQSRGR